MPKLYGTIFISKAPLLTSSQLKIIANIGISTSQLSLGSLVLPFVLPGLDKSKSAMIILGLIITTVFWLLSILIVRNIET